MGSLLESKRIDRERSKITSIPPINKTPAKGSPVRRRGESVDSQATPGGAPADVETGDDSNDPRAANRRRVRTAPGGSRLAALSGSGGGRGNFERAPPSAHSFTIEDIIGNDEEEVRFWVGVVVWGWG